MRNGKLLLAGVAMLVGTAVGGWATETGGGAYQNGAEGFMAGAVPPPGSYFVNYFVYYSADKFADDKGHKAFPDFNAMATADVLRYLYVSKTKILGGYYGAHVFLPVAYLDLKTPGGDDSDSAVGDIIADPFILSWHTRDWHFVSAVDVYIPVGSYDKGEIANIGRHYWTVEPVLGFSYLPKCGFEVSSKFMYDFNTENTSTDYRSGQEFHMDYTVSQHVDKNMALGVGGYYYKQITDDRQNGATVQPDGNKGQVFAIGPQAKYDYQNMSFILKYQTETETRNRPEGQKLWVNFVCAF